MNLDKCYYIGYTSKLHGKQGGIILKLEVDFLEECNKLESVLIQLNKTDTSLIPFFISNTQTQPNGALRIKIDDVDNIVDAKALIGKGVYIPSTALPKLSDNKFYHHEVIDFKVIDINYGEVGQVHRILNFPRQAIFEVINPDQKEILIPVVADFIVKIDRTNKTIEVNIPDGLIDLYLE